MNPIHLQMKPAAREEYQRVAPLFGNALKALYHELQQIQASITYDWIVDCWWGLLQKHVNKEFYEYIEEAAEEMRTKKPAPPRLITPPCIEMDVFSKQTNHLGEEFGKHLCLSVGNCVAHGKNKEEIHPGDLVTIDTGGSSWFSEWTRGPHLQRKLVFDAAFTCVLGSPDLPKIASTPLNALKEIKSLTGNIGVRDIAGIIQRHAWDNKFSVVTALVGHGIGYSMHEWPGIPNAILANTSIKLPPHIMINPEPMYVESAGEKVADVHLDDDGWSVMTTGPSAHWETTFYYDGERLHDIVGITDIS